MKKKVLVIGGGGREHALVWKLSQSPLAGEIICMPGNAGIASLARCENIPATDIEGMTRLALREKVDFAVVAPDDPLVMGAVDALEAAGIPCFGPKKDAAIIEGSKLFAKRLMTRYGIPTARYEAFSDEKSALNYLESAEYPSVVKADGLALGKGVVIAASFEEAREAVHSMMSGKRFGKSGERVVIEEFLTGPEVTVLAFTDGETVIPMTSSMDHKTIGEGGTGLNTGGMGVIAPNPFYTREIARECMERIFLPSVRAMKAEGREFRGCLYFGLMLTERGPKVIEYNCRFGDPEAETVLPLVKTDLMEIMTAVREGKLKELDIGFSDKASCTVMLASGGYPVKYEKGKEIFLNGADRLENVTVFHAGTGERDGKLVTSGGRVLGVTATGDSLREATDRAYAAADMIEFEGKYCRRDIGRSALEAKTW